MGVIVTSLLNSETYHHFGRLMPFEVRWLHLPELLLLRVWGQVTIHEIEYASLEVYRQMDKGSAPVHLVIDIHAVTAYPRQARDISEIAVRYRHASLGYMVICGIRAPAVRLVFSVLTSLTGYKYVMVPKLEDALSFLVLRDSRLPGDLAPH
jgi:hypothetical protein